MMPEPTDSPTPWAAARGSIQTHEPAEVLVRRMRDKSARRNECAFVARDGDHSKLETSDE